MEEGREVKVNMRGRWMIDNSRGFVIMKNLKKIQIALRLRHCRNLSPMSPWKVYRDVFHVTYSCPLGNTEYKRFVFSCWPVKSQLGDVSFSTEAAKKAVREFTLFQPD